MIGLIVLEGAAGQVQGIYNLLEDHQEGLGDKFYQSFLEACELLQTHPRIGLRYRQELRRWLMRDWSIGIFYNPTPIRIMITGVFDLRQDPALIDRWLEQF